MFKLNKLSIVELKDYLHSNGYKINTFLSTQKLIKYIKTLPEYLDYTTTYNQIIEEPDIFLSLEQKKVFVLVFSFLTGIKDRKVIYDTLRLKLIPDISNLILNYISYIDYPIETSKIGLLFGSAGTGKTFLVSNIIFKLLTLLNFEKKEKIIQILAPTNKAIKVIKEKINHFFKNKQNNIIGYNAIIQYSTISKFLKQDIEYTKDGKIKYETNIKLDNTNYKNITHIIIDEASMISSKNWNDLNTFVIRRLKKVKVLLIGDECQLPPVNEKTSVVFKDKYKKFELTEIIRSKSNQLIQIYNLYRNTVNTNKIADVKLIDSKLSNHFKKNDFKYIHSFNIKKSFNIDKDKIISYSNVSVDNYNKLVRNIFFNNPKEKFVKGENLIFGSSVKITSLNNNFMEDKIYYYSNDEVKVISVTKDYINMNFVSNYTDMNIQPFFPEKKFEVYKLLISNDKLYTIYVITTHDYLKFKKYFENSFDIITEYITENKIRKRKISELWDIYYTIKNTINTPVQYSYALTVYKSQGSTFRKVYIDQENIENCIKDITILNKSLYTAVTRASHKIRCYKKEKNDYYIIDVHQFPILKEKIKIDNDRIKKLLQGTKIIYTRNNFNSNTRKLVSAKIISINDKIIVGNTNFEWELKISNDMNFYL